MNSDDRRLILRAEEAALDHGSVDRIVGKRSSSVKSVREAVAQTLTPDEEEAAIEQGTVERVTGHRPAGPPVSEE